MMRVVMKAIVGEPMRAGTTATFSQRDGKLHIWRDTVREFPDVTVVRDVEANEEYEWEVRF